MKKIIKILIVSIVVVVFLVATTFGVSAEVTVTSNTYYTLSFSKVGTVSNLYTSATYEPDDFYVTSNGSVITISETFYGKIPTDMAYRVPIYLKLNGSYSNAEFRLKVRFLDNASVINTDYHRLKNAADNSVLATGSIVNNEYIQFDYEGKVPKEIILEVNTYLSQKDDYSGFTIDIELYDFHFSDNSEVGKILENNNENFDKLLDGDEDLDSSGDTGKVSGSIDNVDDAKDGALGGKSDKEIQAEINSALDSDKIGLDFTKAGRISNFFDNLLNAFGSGYKTLLMLSLSLGLAGFLIGRRWA